MDLKLLGSHQDECYEIAVSVPANSKANEEAVRLAVHPSKFVL